MNWFLAEQLGGSSKGIKELIIQVIAVCDHQDGGIIEGQDDFPREKYNYIQVLYEIINRNYNQINRWTKACAVYSLSNIPRIKVNDSLLAQLFNPDPLFE